MKLTYGWIRASLLSLALAGVGCSGEDGKNGMDGVIQAHPAKTPSSTAPR